MKNQALMRRTLLACGGLAVGTMAIAVFWFLSSSSAPMGKVTANDIATLKARLDLVEQENRNLMAALARKGSGLAGNSTGRELMKKQRQEHERRMLKDPAYAARHERQRLDQLEREFNNEPITMPWASKAHMRVEGALVSAAANAGMSEVQGDVDCRSSQCRVRINIADEGYNDLITHLSIGMGDLLPKSRIVTIPRGDGTYDVSIFATSAKESPATTDG